MAFVFIYLFVSIEAAIGHILHTDYTVIFIFSCNPLNYSSNRNLLLAFCLMSTVSTASSVFIIISASPSLVCIFNGCVKSCPQDNLIGWRKKTEEHM